MTTNSNFLSFLKRNKISDKGSAILLDEEFSEDILRSTPINKILKELREIDVPKGDAVRLRTWRESLNASKNRSQSANRTRSSSRGRSANRTRSNRSRSSSRARSRQAEEPPPIKLYRQESVSEDLLTELTNVETRKLMDRLMEEGTKDVIYQGEPVHLSKRNGFSSDLKQDMRSIYYAWLLPNGKEAFHLTLNHTKNEKHANRSGYNRDVNGAFHLRLITTHSKPIRRILVNLINDVYEITICNGKKGEVERIANIIVPIIAQYYQETGRTSSIVEGRC